MCTCRRSSSPRWAAFSLRIGMVVFLHEFILLFLYCSTLHRMRATVIGRAWGRRRSRRWGQACRTRSPPCAVERCIRAIQLDHLREQRGPELVTRCQRAARRSERAPNYDVVSGARSRRPWWAESPSVAYRAALARGRPQRRLVARVRTQRRVSHDRVGAHVGSAYRLHLPHRVFAWRCTRMSRGS